VNSLSSLLLNNSGEDNFIPLIDSLILFEYDCWIGLNKSHVIKCLGFNYVEVRNNKNNLTMLIFPSSSYNMANIYVVNSLTFIVEKEKVKDVRIVYN